MQKAVSLFHHPTLKPLCEEVPRWMTSDSTSCSLGGQAGVKDTPEAVEHSQSQAHHAAAASVI